MVRRYEFRRDLRRAGKELQNHTEENADPILTGVFMLRSRRITTLALTVQIASDEFDKRLFLKR